MADFEDTRADARATTPTAAAKFDPLCHSVGLAIAVDRLARLDELCSLVQLAVDKAGPILDAAEEPCLRQALRAGMFQLTSMVAETREDAERAWKGAALESEA